MSKIKKKQRTKYIIQWNEGNHKENLKFFNSKSVKN